MTTTEVHHDTSLIPVDLIQENGLNPRRGKLDAEKLGELKASIEQIGLLHPLVLRPHAGGDGEYELVAGRRRLAALRELGWSMAPALVLGELGDDEAAREAALEENIQREQLDPFDEAHALSELTKKHGIRHVADRVGKTPRWVARRANLTTLLPGWRKRYQKGELGAWTGEHLELIAMLDRETQEKLLKNSWFPEEHSELEDLRLRVRDETRVLRMAPWKLDDETLVPKAGACTTCLSNTHNTPDLFGDLGMPAPRGRFGWQPPGCRPRTGKDEPACTNASCWREKLTAHRDAQLAKLTEKHGKDQVVLLKDAGPRRGLDPAVETPKGVKPEDPHAWKACKAKEKGARPAVVVNGLSAGKTMYVKPATSSRSRGGSGRSASPAKKPKEMTPAEAKAALEERKKKLADRRRTWIVDQIRGALHKLQDADRVAGEKLDAIGPEQLVMLMTHFGATDWSFEQDLEKILAQPLDRSAAWVALLPGIERPLQHYQAAHEEQQDLAVQVAAKLLDGWPSTTKEARAALSAQAEEQIPTPKSWKALKETAGRKKPVATKKRARSAGGGR